MYRIYSNRSRTLNSSHTHAQTRLNGCGHDRKCDKQVHLGQNHGRRWPWLAPRELLWRSYIDYLKYRLRKPVFCAKIFVDYTVKYWSEINKSRPRSVATPKQGWYYSSRSYHSNKYGIYKKLIWLTIKLLLLSLPVHFWVARSHSPRQLIKLKLQSLSLLHTPPSKYGLRFSLEKSVDLNIEISRSIALATKLPSLFVIYHV